MKTLEKKKRTEQMAKENMNSKKIRQNRNHINRISNNHSNHNNSSSSNNKLHI